MESMLKRAMIYLGLGPDEFYDNNGEEQNLRRPGVDTGGYSDHLRPAAVPGGVRDPDPPAVGRTVRPIPVNPDYDAHHVSDTGVVGMDPTVRPSHPAGGGRISRKPHAVSPQGFNQAKEIADRLKSGQAVIVNLQAVNRDLRRRLVDFSSGLCYGRDGKMDRVADQVYLLTPAEAEPPTRQIPRTRSQ